MCSLGTDQRDWSWSDPVVGRKKQNVNIYNPNPLLLPDFQGEDSWLAQSAARSLTKLRDRS